MTQVLSAEVDLEELKRFRDVFPAWLDNDKFSLE
jgi:hypothetical protein